MAAEDLTLEQLAEQINQNTVAEKSREVYLGNIVKLLNWLTKNEPELITQELLSFRVAHRRHRIDQPLSRQLMRQFLSSAPRSPPIKFDQLSTSKFEVYLLDLKKKDGSRPGRSV